MTEFLQAGLRFEWPYGSRRLIIKDKQGRELGDLGVGNIFDSKPATLDEVHDAIDAYCGPNQP
jgi:hypothetical protein